jgi:MtN3 and saliva related transmembrane protein
MSTITLNVLGFVAGVLTTAAFIPQVLKIWRTRAARDISLGMYLVFTSGVALWLVYGIALGSLPIIVANVCTLALALAILLMKLHYG